MGIQCHTLFSLMNLKRGAFHLVFGLCDLLLWLGTLLGQDAVSQAGAQQQRSGKGQRANSSF
jgi:hypothetical protein